MDFFNKILKCDAASGFETEKFHKKGTPILLLALFCVVDAFVYVDIIYKNPYVHDVEARTYNVIYRPGSCMYKLIAAESEL